VESLSKLSIKNRELGPNGPMQKEEKKKRRIEKRAKRRIEKTKKNK